MRSLQVDPLSGGIGGQKYLYSYVLLEAFFGFFAVFPTHATVNGDNSFWVAKECTDPLFQVVEGVSVFGEDDYFAAVSSCIEHLRFILQKMGKLFPLTVFSAPSNGIG